MIVEVVWNDAISDETTFTNDQTEDIAPLKVTSVGMLWIDDDDKLVIARETFPENNYRGVLVIPKKMVVSVRNITHQIEVLEKVVAEQEELLKVKFPLDK